MQFPENDNDFEETTITEANGDRERGWQITKSDGWSFFIEKDSPLEPATGMTVRFYGKGLGYAVRGVFLDGQKVYYRTEAEENEHREIELYGADAKDWLERWDAGKTVWSIEMGGLGPGYEQAIQMTAAELLRFVIEKGYNREALADGETWAIIRDEIQNASFVNPVVDNLGLSGAQFGAAMNVAINIYRHGPRFVMNDERVKDRHIQVSKNFPGMAATN